MAGHITDAFSGKGIISRMHNSPINRSSPAVGYRLLIKQALRGKHFHKIGHALYTRLDDDQGEGTKLLGRSGIGYKYWKHRPYILRTPSMVG